MRSLRVTAAALLLGAAFFIFWSAFEIYVLTTMNGPQMIFFSITHLWPWPVLVAFYLSWLLCYLYVGLAIVVSIAGSSQPLASHRQFVIFCRISAVALSLHLVAFHTYDAWSNCFGRA